MEPNEPQEPVEEAIEEVVETPEEPQETVEELKEQIRKLEIEKGIAQRERTKATREKAKIEADSKKVTGELDNADYALLEVRGIMDGDTRIDFIKEKMAKWNLPLRELLKDEDIQSKLKSMKIEGDVRAATPGATRRAASGTSDNEDYFYQKYLTTGKLPDVMPSGMAEKLVNRRYEQDNPRQNPFE